MTVDEITVAINANLDPVRRQMEALNRQSAQTNSRLEEVARSAKGAEKATRDMGNSMQRASVAARQLVAALSIQQVAQFTFNAIRAVAELGRIAQMAGLTTNEMQGLAFAFRDTGIAEEQFSQAALALSRNLADLQRGTGPLLDFLRQSAPQFIDAFRNANSTAEAFSVLSDAVASLGTNQDRLRLATAAGGEQMQRLVPVLAQGGQAINNLAKEFQGLTPEAVKTAQEIERRFQEIVLSMRNFLVSTIVTVTDLFSRSRSEWNRLMEGFRTGVVPPEGLKSFEELLKGLRDLGSLPGDTTLLDPRRFAAAQFEAEQLTARLLGQRTVLDELSIGWNTHAQEVARALTLINSAYADSAEAQRAATRLQVQLQLQQQQAILQTATIAAQAITALFPKQKGAAIAAAVINTAVGVTKALSEVPWPWNWVQAGLIAAQGVAQIAAIRSANPSGGGSVASPGGGGGGATPVGGGEEGGPAQRIVIEGVDPSAIFTGEQLNGLIEQINIRAQNGHVVIASKLV